MISQRTLLVRGVPRPVLARLSLHSRYSTEKDSAEKKWLLSRLIERPLERILYPRFTSDENLARLVSKGASISFFSLGTMSVLSTIGLDLTPLLAGFSVLGFAASFAAKDIATNLFCGFLLVFQKPFKTGDFVRIVSANVEGIVESIEVRCVRLRNADSIYVIPSTVVYNSPIQVKKEKK